MELIIIGFHIALVVSIILLIQAIREKKKMQALEAQKAQDSNSNASLTSTTSSNSSAASTASSATSATISEPVSEQQKAVQLVHDGLEHVVDHLSHLGTGPEMSLAEANVKASTTNDAKSIASATANGIGDATGNEEAHVPENGDGTKSSTARKNCPSCNEPWDNAFDFCLKCSHK